MSIRTRIVVGLTLLGLLVLVGSAYLYRTINVLVVASDRVVDEEIPALARLDRLQELIGEVHALETQILSEDRTDVDRRAFDERLATMKQLVYQIEPLPLSGPTEQQINAYKKIVTSLLATEADIMTLQDHNNLFDARQLSTEIIATRIRIQELSAQLLTQYRNFIDDREKLNLIELNVLRRAVRACAIIGVLATLLLMISGVRSFLLPLNHLVRVTERISRGNAQERADETRPDEFGQLGQSFNIMVDSLHQRIEEVAGMNARLREADRDHRRQLTLAKNVQKSIVPRTVSVPGLDVFARIQAARMIGGDFYDVHFLREANSERSGQKPCVGLVVGDASGNGIPAALVMVLTITLMREASRQTTDPGVILERVNHGILEQFPNELIETFVTASYVAIDLASMTLRLASAGNEPPILWRQKDRQISSLEVEGMFLGTFEDSKYRVLELPLEAGDKILLCSDGLTESRAPDGDFFGRERLETLMRENAHLPCKSLGDHIFNAVSDFSEDPTPRDDVALLVVEILVP